MQTYTVKEGDSLSKISEKFYGNWSGVDAIAKANGITNINLIHPGQTLNIPPNAGASNSSATVVEDAVVVDESGSRKNLTYILFGNKRWMWWVVAAAAAGGYYYHKKTKGKGAKKSPAKPLNGTKRKSKRKK